MAVETKSHGQKVESTFSKSLHQRFKSRCKKLNVSMAQRIGDLAQQDVKRR